MTGHIHTDITIEQARPADAADVAAILRDGAAYKSAHGDGVWEWRDFSDESLRQLIEDETSATTIYIARRKKIAAATFAITWQDPEMWGDQPPIAGYIHKLATHDAARGQHLGAYILDWTSGLVAEHGRSVLRLDAPRDNHQLRGYYERQGFTWVRDQALEVPYGTYAASLYERPVAVHNIK